MLSEKKPQHAKEIAIKTASNMWKQNAAVMNIEK